MKHTVLSLAAAALVLTLGSSVHAGGTTAPAAAKPSASAPAAKPTQHAGGARHAAVAKLNLNTCTREQLAALPGLSVAIADKIIAARPFTMRSELAKKSLVTKAEYSRIHNLVTVKKPS